MEYRQQWVNVTRQTLCQVVEAAVSPSRFQHILRVEETALALAEHYGIDLEQVSIAALAHDLCKDMPVAEQQRLATAYWNYPGLVHEPSAILHGFAAAQTLKEMYQCETQTILDAVAGHTIGWYEMSDVAKVVYIADYIEPERHFPGVDQARQLAWVSLEEAMWYKMQQTLMYLVQRRQPLFTGAVEIYNAWRERY